MKKSGSSKRVVIAAVTANLLIAIAKFIVAAISGSSAILSEAIHSLVDTGDGTLLYIGLQRSRKPPDETHPFGHGKELYFWTLVVATLVFAVGGGMSTLQGITHLIHPHPLANALWSYLVLLIALVFESTSWVISVREFRKSMGGRGVWQTITETKDPSIFAIVFEDSAALLGICIAFLGVFLGHALNNPFFDGLASILIGLLLMTTALLLARETRGLLIGESASGELVGSVRRLASEEPSVLSVGRILSVHYGPDFVALNIELTFRSEFSAGDAARAIDRLERRIRRQHGQIKSVSIQVEAEPSQAREGPT